MIKKIAIIVLLALVLGFYFFPETTKDAVDTTGDMVKEVSGKVFDDVKDNDDFKDSFDELKDNVKEEIDDIDVDEIKEKLAKEKDNISEGKE